MASDEIKSSAIPELGYIPDQMIAAGKNVEIDFSEFTKLSVAENDNMEYSISDFPPGFTIDPKTGVVTGFVPETDKNQSYLVSLTLINLATNAYAHAMFRLEVIGSVMLETPEAKALFAARERTIWDTIKAWELKLFIQQLLTEHFAWVMIYDAKHLGSLGKFQSRRMAKTGWEIINFQNAVMITPGNKAFEQYGNRGRILDTLREAFKIDVSVKKWSKLSFKGSDPESIGKAWVIGKELDMPVSEDAPSDAAQINYYNLNRIYGASTPSKPKPQMGS